MVKNMSVCLNTNSAYKDFNRLVHDKYFVDKSDIIEKINTRINVKNRYICITKPRRLGKISILNMLGSFYCKAYDAKPLFDHLAISKSRNYTARLNKYNVINICLSNLPDKGNSGFLTKSLWQSLKPPWKMALKTVCHAL